MPRLRDRTGDRYGMLVVRERGPSKADGRVTWVCECDCGGVRVASGNSLQSGNTKTCGCRPTNTKHGRTHTPEWRRWASMRARCLGKTGVACEQYALRGITICERWLSSFDAFLEDMGPMPHDRTTIDRIDNGKGYEPGNCRWASVAEQNRNRTNNVNVTVGEKTMTVAEWAHRIGVSATAIHSRLSRGWDPERAVTEPPPNRYRRKQHQESVQ